MVAAVAAQASPGAALASAAPARVGIEHALARQIAAVVGHDGGVPVLLPSTLALPRPVYGAGGPSRTGGGYQLVIGSWPGCDGANVCALAEFAAIPGAHPDGAPTTLARGIQGSYAPPHCAGDCSAATIGWREHGVLYTIAARPAVAATAVRATLVAAADQAILAGPR
jgi:hypothetical protein